MGKRIAFVSLLTLLCHCAGAYEGQASDERDGGTTTTTTSEARAATAALTLAELPDVVVTAGTTTMVPVTIARVVAGAPVVITVEAPDDIDGAPVTIPGDQTTGQVALAVVESATFTATTLTVTASSNGVSVARPLKVSLRGASGTFDRSFGADGIRTAVQGTLPATAVDLATWADGSTTLLANNSTRALLVDLDAQGTPSTTATLLERAGALAAVGEKVLVGGADREGKVILRRFSRAGVLDVGFGGGGVTIATDPAKIGVRSIVALPDGRSRVLYAASAALVGGFLDTGATDTAWGEAGTSTIFDGTNAVPLSLAKIDGGFAVYALGRTNSIYRTVKLDTAGTRGETSSITGPATGADVLHGASGKNGLAYFPTYVASSSRPQLFEVGAAIRAFPVAGGTIATSVAVQDDGKVIVAVPTGGGVLVQRQDPATGALDPTFGRMGMTEVMAESASFARVYVQPDGRLIGFATGGGAITMFRLWL